MRSKCGHFTRLLIAALQGVLLDLHLHTLKLILCLLELPGLGLEDLLTSSVIEDI